MDRITKKLTAKNILVAFLGAGSFYLLFTSLMTSKFSQLEADTRALLAEQQATMILLAEATARGGADAVVESIIRDCSLAERNEFDVLLGRLDKGLSQAELTMLDRLFGRCGTFYSARKAVMVAKLARETGVYETYVNQLSTIVGEDLSDSFSVLEWQALAEVEHKQSDHFTQLVGLQDKIISQLLAGKNQNSPEIQGILNMVRVTQEALTVTNQQASSIRFGLVSL